MLCSYVRPPRRILPRRGNRPLDHRPEQERRGGVESRQPVGEFDLERAGSGCAIAARTSVSRERARLCACLRLAAGEIAKVVPVGSHRARSSASGLPQPLPKGLPCSLPASLPSVDNPDKTGDAAPQRTPWSQRPATRLTIPISSTMRNSAADPSRATRNPKEKSHHSHSTTPTRPVRNQSERRRRCARSAQRAQTTPLSPTTISFRL